MDCVLTMPKMENITVKEEIIEESLVADIDNPQDTSMKDEVESEITTKDEPLEHVLIKSESNREDCDPVLRNVKIENEFEEFDEPDQIPVEDIDTILHEETNVKKELVGCNDQNESMESESGNDSATPAETHDGIDEKPFKCEVCEKEISTVRECERGKNEIAKKIPPKTAAQYSREYRARKKALKNAHSQSVDRTLNKKPKTPAERSREFRARKKALANAWNEHSKTCSSIIFQADAQQFVGHIRTSKKIPKTPAERIREYRARKKALENAANEHFITSSPKTATERSREYRARNKALENAPNEHLMTSSAKTPAELSFEYRARKKSLENAANEHSSAKTSTERSRIHRARKKALKNTIKHLPTKVLLDNDICVTNSSTETDALNDPSIINQEHITFEGDPINETLNTQTLSRIDNNTSDLRADDWWLPYTIFHHHS